MTMPVHQAQSPNGRDELAWTATGQGTPANGELIARKIPGAHR